MRTFRHWKAVAFLTVFVLINCILCFLLEPWRGASDRMWKGYYKEDHLDMVFVGTSVCQQTFIPRIFDHKMGVNSYNMGTPSQAVTQTKRAIEVAVEEHHVKKIIYGMGFSSFKFEQFPEAALTFESARVRNKGGVKGLIDTLAYIYSKDVRDTDNSINFLFPWVYNYEDFSLETLKENATKKVERLKAGGKKYNKEKGYQNDDKRVFNLDNRWETNTNQYYESYFNASMMKEFEQLLAYCKENEVELIIINTPHPAFDVISCYEYYEDNQKQFRSYCENYGAKYYDFSLVKPDVFENKIDYFCDYEHLNRKGSELFCKKLSDFLVEESTGKDMSQYFYTIEEFFAIHAEELENWKEWNE